MKYNNIMNIINLKNMSRKKIEKKWNNGNKL